jgi:hypothetical protein
MGEVDWLDKIKGLGWAAEEGAGDKALKRALRQLVREAVIVAGAGRLGWNHAGKAEADRVARKLVP